MPPRRAICQVCTANESKYSCSTCMVLYCSVACYKRHKDISCSSHLQRAPKRSKHDKQGPRGLNETQIPQKGPLNESHTEITDTTTTITNKNDGNQEEPISSNDRNQEQPPTESRDLLPLTSLKWPYVPEESAYPDPLKRDDPKTLQLHQYEAIATSSAVRHALGGPDNSRLRDLLRSIDKLRGEGREDAIQRALGVSSSDVKPPGPPSSTQNNEDVQALRKLAEAVEAAVRGGKEDVLGLNWSDI